MEQVNNVINSIDNLSLNIDDFHYVTDFTNRAYSQMTSKNLIGEGGVGKVFLINNGKYVVKQVAPCDTDNQIIYKYCTDILTLMNEDKPFILIPSAGKWRYSLPNLLSEIAIGMFFTDMVNKLISVNFTRTLYSFILKQGNKIEVYIVMDAHKPIITSGKINPNMGLNTPIHYLYLMFQTAHGLLQAQQQFKFTHYDLHIENMLWNNFPENKNYINYPVPNRSDKLRNIMIPKTSSNFIVKITDYGLSRMETDKVLITPKLDVHPDATYGEFNPSYDYTSFIGTTMMDYRHRGPFNFLFSDLELFRKMLLFVLWMFKDDTINIPKSANLKQLQDFQMLIGKKYWRTSGKSDRLLLFRPKPIETNLVAYYDTRSMVEIVNRLAEMMFAFNAIVPYQNRDDVINIRRLSENYVSFLPIKVFQDKYDSMPIPKPDDIVTQLKQYILEKDAILINRYKILFNHPPEYYNISISENQYKNCPIQEHYLTSVKINKKASKLKGYNFKSLCCKLDPASYIRTNQTIGITINGGFFNIKEDYIPIGEYKDSQYESELYQIPEQYRDVYGYVIINQFGDLNIIRDLKTDIGLKSIFASGPILIENGKVVFDPNQERFSCVNPKNVGSGIKVLNKTDRTVTVSGYNKYSSNKKSCKGVLINEEKTFLRCDKIKPGELSHANNPNPRSAIGITNNGDYIFLTVEGRDQRGIGMDLYMLAKTTKMTFPNIKSLINLDGGRSSNLAWRSRNEPETIYITNSDHIYQYPVGNILSFEKNI